MRAFRVLFVVIALGLSALHFAAPTAVSAQAPTTLDDYRRAVEQTITLIEQARALPVAERTPLLAQARAVLEPIRSVRLASGASITIDNASILALVQDANKTDQAADRLTALRRALAATPAVLNPNDLTTLRDILNKPPFHFDAAAPWWADLLQRILEFWNSLFGRAVGGVFEARDWFVLAGLIVVIVVVLYFVRNLRRNLVSEQALVPLLNESEVRSPAEAFDNAQRFINAGDYRSAVRQLYLATLLILDQRGKIKYDPTLTNRQVLRQAANDPRTTAALVPIVETFDRVWYGFEPLTLAEFDAYRQRVEQVRE